MPILKLALIGGIAAMAICSVAAWPAHWNEYEGAKAYSIATDLSGNVYVAGSTYNSGDRFALVKYDPAGSVLWYRTYAGNRDVKKMVVSADSVYVAGANYDDGFVMRYSVNGALMWNRTIVGSADMFDYVRDVTLAKDGGVLVVGSIGYATNNGAFVRKYNSSGTLSWSKTDLPTAPTRTHGMCVEVDSDGNVVVAKSTGDGQVLHTDLVFEKYSSAGSKLWSTVVDSDYHGQDSVDDIAIDSAGNVGYAGQCTDGTLISDMLFGKLSSSGQPKWQKRIGEAGVGEGAERIVALPNNAFIVAGTESNPITKSDIVTMKYSANGERLWSDSFLGDIYSSVSADNCKDLQVAADGSIYVAGSTYVLRKRPAYVVIKYAANGVRQWVQIDTPDAESSTEPVALAIGHGYGYLTGSTYSDGDYRMSTYRFPTG